MILTKKTFWIPYITILFLFPLVRSFLQNTSKQVPIIKTLSKDLKLIRSDGQKFSLLQFSQYIIFNLHFTRCPGDCIDLMKKTQTLQVKMMPFQHLVHILSLTIDPYDSLEILQNFAKEQGANKNLWSFVKATEEEFLENYLKEELYLSMSLGKDIFELAHSVKFVLIDPQHRIRGYYNDIDPLLLDFGFLMYTP